MTNAPTTPFTGRHERMHLLARLRDRMAEEARQAREGRAVTFYTDAELINTDIRHVRNRDAILAWLTANRLDPNLVRMAKAGRRYITVEEYVVDDDGQKQIDPDDENRALTRTRRVLMVVDPPTLDGDL